jgi:hypothetical protein
MPLPSPLRDRTTWVYELRDTDDTLLYVGVAVDVDRRIAQHAATKYWWREVIFINAARYATRKAALEVEAHTILTKSPIYNVQGVPPEPPHEPIGRRHYINPPQGVVLEAVQKDWR